MVMAQSLFKYLHQQQETTIDVLAPGWVIGLVERMSEIRRGIAFASRHGKLDLMMRIRSGRSLRSECYDEAIVMPRSLKAAIPSWLAGIPRRSGFSRNLGLINSVRQYRKDRRELFVRRYLALASDSAYELDWQEIPRPSLTIDLDNRQALVRRFGLMEGRFVAFAPGAEFGPAKQWPLDRFAELAGRLAERGLQVVVLGSEKDGELARQIATMSDNREIIDLCGRTSIADVVDLASASHGMIVNDSGLMHLGYASGARVVAIYGSSSSAYTPPLAESAVILEQQLECQPCFDRQCRFGHYDCLKGIGVDDVLATEVFADQGGDNAVSR